MVYNLPIPEITQGDCMQIVFLFYQGMTALDAVGPHEVLSHLPGASVKRVGRTPPFDVGSPAKSDQAY